MEKEPTVNHSGTVTDSENRAAPHCRILKTRTVAKTKTGLMLQYPREDHFVKEVSIMFAAFLF